MYHYIFGTFLVGLIIYFFWAKNKFKDSVLGKVALLPSEKILHDDNPVIITVVSRTQHGTGVHPNSIVRITNQRLIIAQKPWFSKKPPEQWPLLLIMHRDATLPLPGGVTSGLLSVGYRTVGIANIDISPAGKFTDAIISITVDAPGDITMLEKILVETSKPELYL